MKAKISVVACSAPPEGYSRWTMQMIVDELIRLEEAFTLEKAKHLAECFEWYFTPEHGSLLDIAEIEIGVMCRKRVPNRSRMPPALSIKCVRVRSSETSAVPGLTDNLLQKMRGLSFLNLTPLYFRFILGKTLITVSRFPISQIDYTILYAPYSGLSLG